MTTADKNLVAVALDAHGRRTVVYQDHDGVTLDLGLTDRNFDLDQIDFLIDKIITARYQALAWRRRQQKAARDDQ